jgi:adenylyltransferase/sulfurtransferase
MSVSFSEFIINKSSGAELTPSSTASSSPPFSTEVDKIDVVELSKLLSESNSNYVLIDVRSLQEREISVISGSLSIPLIQISDGSSLDYLRELVFQGKKLFVHCKAGGRSLEAVRMLNLENIPATDVEGGIDSWTSLVDQSLSIY